MSKKGALYRELNMSGAEAPGPCTEQECVVEFLLFSCKCFCTVQFGMWGVRVLYRELRPLPYMTGRITIAIPLAGGKNE